ncbi:MAG: acyl-CoA dehydrogenase family protein [Terriglobales bacterium]
MDKAASPFGGSFLLAAPAATFTPEQFNEQQQLIAATAEQFAQQEIAPATEAIEGQDFALARRLLRQAGELGLTGVDVPEAYGGQGMDFTASAIVADHLAVQGSFSVIFGAHAGIATLPLVHFGNEEQKRKYLPRLASSEWVGAYALSEAGSGSDALALRTEAVAADGGYRLNGEKMWISNAGFADLFTLFAKVDGKVTAFLVERTTPGVATGAEEHKMGILGSSTCPVLLRDAAVAAANVLGGVGEGAHIAFQILDVGRFKLGAACIGGARNCLREAVHYARERRAFGKTIGEFGLVRRLLAEMGMRLFAAESMVYRTVALMDGGTELGEFAVECSIIKIFASEMADVVVDHAVQIYGGNGFVRGNPAERAYRDARVNRIFEGTNEINRLLIPATLLRRAQQGKLALLQAVEAVTAGLLTPAPAAPALAPAEAARQTALLVAGLSFQRHGEALAEQQQLLGAIADLATAAYALQSAALRAPEGVYTRLLQATLLDEVEVTARRALAALSQGDALRTQLAWLRRLLKRDPVDVYALELQAAERLLDDGGYRNPK